jgi:hypothetical protein
MSKTGHKKPPPPASRRRPRHHFGVITLFGQLFSDLYF